MRQRSCVFTVDRAENLMVHLFRNNLGNAAQGNAVESIFLMIYGALCYIAEMKTPDTFHYVKVVQCRIQKRDNISRLGR